MERLRLTNTEKQALIEEFTAKVNAANKLTDITFTSKGIINELNAKDVIKPTVIIDVETMYKMQSLVDASSVEISWHGFVKRNAEKYPVSKAYGTSSKYTELIEDGET